MTNPLVKIIEEEKEKFEKMFVKITVEKEEDFPKAKIMQGFYDAVFQAEKKEFTAFHSSSLLAVLQGIDKWAEKAGWTEDAGNIVVTVEDLHQLLEDTIKQIKG